jgi:hypothetical protein
MQVSGMLSWKREMRKLFLDDERVPEDVTWITMHDGPWDIVRSYPEFRAYIDEHGIPDVISFDNDLGPNVLEGYHCAEHIADCIVYGILPKPEGFQYTVHSMNSIAVDRIKDILNAALEIDNERVDKLNKAPDSDWERV